jgi:hypothetical protein
VPKRDVRLDHGYWDPITSLRVNLAPYGCWPIADIPENGGRGLFGRKPWRVPRSRTTYVPLACLCCQKYLVKSAPVGWRTQSGRHVRAVVCWDRPLTVGVSYARDPKVQRTIDSREGQRSDKAGASWQGATTDVGKLDSDQSRGMGHDLCVGSGARR